MPFYSLLTAALLFLAVQFAPAKAQEVTEIVFASGPDGSGTVQQMVDAFNELHRGEISVRWRQMSPENDAHRQQLIDQVLEGQGLIIHSPIMPQSWAYNPEVKTYPHSTKRAIELLEQAGWVLPDPNEIGFGELRATEALVRSKDGQRLEFTLLTNDVPDRIALANAIAEQWAQIGIQVYVQALSMSELTLDHLRPRDFDAVLSQWQSLPPDPDPYPVWHSTQIGPTGQNYSGFVDRDADEAIEVARQITDAGQRTELYYQFQEIFGEQVPAILLYQAVYTFGVDKSARHVQIAPMSDPSGRFRSISDWGLLEQEVLLCDLNDQIGDKLDKRAEP